MFQGFWTSSLAIINHKIGVTGHQEFVDCASACAQHEFFGMLTCELCAFWHIACKNNLQDQYHEQKEWSSPHRHIECVCICMCDSVYVACIGVCVCVCAQDMLTCLHMYACAFYPFGHHMHTASCICVCTHVHPFGHHTHSVMCPV